MLFLAVSKAPAQELVPDVRLSVRPSVRLSVCHSLYTMKIIHDLNKIRETDTYTQECGIEPSPNFVRPLVQLGG